MVRSALAGLLLTLSAAVQAQTCNCVDIGDIKRRMKEAQAALDAYGAEMQKMAEQMQRTQQPLPYTADRRKILQGRVQDALNQVSTGIQTAPVSGDNPGGTDNLCNTTINLHPSATACMRESVRRHEEHHRQECLKTRSAGAILKSIATGKDRFERNEASLIEYALEEVGGYGVEMAFLQDELTRLESSPACKPKEPRKEVRDYTAQPRRAAP